MSSCCHNNVMCCAIAGLIMGLPLLRAESIFVGDRRLPQIDVITEQRVESPRAALSRIGGDLEMLHAFRRDLEDTMVAITKDGHASRVGVYRAGNLIASVRLAGLYRASLISPNREQLVVVCDDRITLIDTRTGTVVGTPFGEVFSNVVDVAWAWDSRTLYVLAQSDSRSALLAATDVAAHELLATRLVDGHAAAVSVSRNGEVHVSVQNWLYVMNGVTLRMNRALSVRGTCGKAVFGNVVANEHTIALNKTPTTGYSAVVIHGRTGAVHYVGRTRWPLTQVFWMSADTAIAYSYEEKQIYQITVGDVGARIETTGWGDFSSRILALQATVNGNDLVAVTEGSIVRWDLASQQVTSLPGTYASPVLAVSAPEAPSTGLVGGLVVINAQQRLSAIDPPAPVGVRVFDNRGNGMRNVPVRFIDEEGTVVSKRTDEAGYSSWWRPVSSIASVRVEAAGATGSAEIIRTQGEAAAPEDVAIPLTLTAVGSGQFVREGHIAGQPLRVCSEDQSDLSNARWSVDGPGMVTTPIVTGHCAETTFIASGIGSEFYRQVIVTVEHGRRSASFHIAVVRRSWSGGGIAPIPVAEVWAPTDGAILGGAGDVVRDAIVVAVAAQTGPAAGLPMHDVSVVLVTPEGEPYPRDLLRCTGPVITSPAGTAHCDLVLAGPPGRYDFAVLTGGDIVSRQLTAIITPAGDTPHISGMVNAASRSSVISGGQLATILGTSLADPGCEGAGTAMALESCGVSASLDGRPLPIQVVNSTEAHVLLPTHLGTGPATAKIFRRKGNVVTQIAAAVNVSRAADTFIPFRVDASYTAVTTARGELVTSTHRARCDEPLILWGTGHASAAELKARASVGTEMVLQPSYRGSSHQLGLQQINFTVPADLVRSQCGTGVSTADVTLTVTSVGEVSTFAIPIDLSSSCR